MKDIRNLSKTQLIKMMMRKEHEIAELKAENHHLKKHHSKAKDHDDNFFPLEEILALMPGYIFWKNREGRCLGCNNNLARFLNLTTPREIIGKRNIDLMPNEFAVPLDTMDMDIMHSGEGRYLEETGIDADQKPAIFFTQKIPLRNQSGKVVGLLGISMDITERKKIEEDLKIAKEKAETSSRAKSQFLALINHELRTPLTGIMGLVNLLKQDNLSNDEEHHIIEDLEKCTHHLLTLVNDVLDFTRLEANKASLHITTVNLNNLIQDVFGILAALAKNKGLKLLTHCDGQIPKWILTDAHMLRQTLINLISNAIKFTDQGYIAVNIRYIEQITNRVRLEIAVSDTGQGIPSDKIKCIFEPFSQLEDIYTRESSRGGTGLGLAIVKRLASLLGIEIHVFSKEGQGSTFSLTGEFAISNMRGEDSPYVASDATSHLAQPIQSKKQTCRVLLVEDDRIVQHVHKKMLIELGCEVDVASCGKEALEMLNQHHLMFVDIGLSDIAGFEVIKEVRKRNGLDEKTLPIIALTGYSGEPEKLACLRAGANEVAIKPISSGSLKAILMRYRYH